MNKIYSLAAIAALALSATTAQAEKLYVNAVDGTVSVFNNADLSAITFEGSTMTVTPADGSEPVTFNVDEVACVTNAVIVNGHECVDLGLPSGTHWATTNVGASEPWQAGNYYAWGEKTTKTSYTQANYKWYRINATSLQFQGVVDDNYELTPNWDAATIVFGAPWHTPTLDQFEELMDNCIWKWTRIGDISGYRITGDNNNSIFLPAAGYYSGSKLMEYDTEGNYWISYGCPEQSQCYKASVNITSNKPSWSYYYPEEGHNIRCVVNASYFEPAAEE